MRRSTEAREYLAASVFSLPLFNIFRASLILVFFPFSEAEFQISSFSSQFGPPLLRAAGISDLISVFDGNSRNVFQFPPAQIQTDLVKLCTVHSSIGNVFVDVQKSHVCFVAVPTLADPGRGCSRSPLIVYPWPRCSTTNGCTPMRPAGEGAGVEVPF